MRFEDWDVLLFPKDSKVPMKEFKTNCHVVHDTEFTKNGDLEVLKFPQFRSELLRQSYWSPADEVGRIKIVISEGFPRDSLTVPIERVKNVVAFSFQHAPLDILESSGIAWPNPAMWRRGPFNPTMPSSSQQHEDGPEAHLHSPRRRSSFAKSAASSSGYNLASATASQMNASNFVGSMPNTQSLLQRGINGPQVGYIDPFNPSKTDMASYFDWSNTLGVVGNAQAADMGKGKTASRRANTHSKMSASDTSMPDYTSSNSTGAQLMTDFQPMSFVVSHIDEPDTGNLAPKVPANTPTPLVDGGFVDDLGIDINKLGTPGSTPPPTDFFSTSTTNFSTELATSLTHSLLNQPHPLPVQGSNIGMPAPEIKSRKENRLNEAFIEGTTSLDHIDMRILFTHGNIEPNPTTDSRIGSGSDKGIKRTRQFTPASAKAIDDEDEPRRSSPRGRSGLGEQVAETH
ncbi:hypothetical protein O1611_g8339 [Lasiodiplodia mahajangana]|uniref:Uncharacterized protein n=1 Tax=Lasiodiplodia mahajangana TaxID=1108764 RepID=A0ACC2JCQ4_9PEZI|nr:hypothetical protein O1611_g8339 [Lasiodiplodia mahajangana]